MGLNGTNRTSSYATMVRFFEEDDWHVMPMEGKPALLMNFSGENGRWRCYAHARDGQHQFVFYSALSTYVPQNRRVAMSDFITRANYGMIVGNFEMDMDDGEVRFKTIIDTADAPLTVQQIKLHVYVNVITMDRYLPGVMKVGFGDAEPKEAVVAIESSPDE